MSDQELPAPDDADNTTDIPKEPDHEEDESVVPPGVGDEDASSTSP